MKGENNISIDYPEGIFTTIVLEFLDYKRNLGYKYNDGRMYSLRKILTQLNQYSSDSPKLTEQMVLEIRRKKSDESLSTQSIRTTLLRQLAIYMNQRGYEAYILPYGCYKYQKSSFKAFIYSEPEIIDVIRTCDDYCQNSQFLTTSAKIVYPFLLRTLYACGLRISEVLRLKSDDVNLEEKFVFIRESKKNKSRYVPVSNSLTENLKIYERLKKENDIRSYDESYFPAPDGCRYSKSAASRQIKIFIAAANVRRTSKGNFPRIHDLRHTAAVRILEKLDTSGVDLNLHLPLVSIFLGHDTFWETEQYLQFPYYSFNRMQDLEVVLNIIPEVDEDE